MKHKVQWDDEQRSFESTPIFFSGLKKLDCQHGEGKLRQKEREKLRGKKTWLVEYRSSAMGD